MLHMLATRRNSGIREKGEGSGDPPRFERRPLHHATIPPFHHSTTPPLHHSTTPPLHHSTTPTLPHSHTPTLRSTTRAYTLIEILVVVGIFSILGSVLISLLYGAVRTWRQGEASRQAFQAASVAIEQLKEDLTSVYTVESKDKTYSPAERVEVQFICRYVKDEDSTDGYVQELTLVRTIPQIVRNIVASTAGNLVDDDKDKLKLETAVNDDFTDDEDGDRWMLRNDGIDNDGDGNVDEDAEGILGINEAGTGGVGEGTDEEWYNLVDDDGDGKVDEDLRPLGDLMIVRYVALNGTLYRGVQAPLAMNRDPLDPRRATEEPDTHERFAITAPSKKASEYNRDGFPISPLTTGVLYFGVRFWTPHTTNWEEGLGKDDPDGNGDVGPEEIWDSTRGLRLVGTSPNGRIISIYKKDIPDNDIAVDVALPALDVRPSTAEKRIVSGSSTPLEFYYYKPPTNVVGDYNYRPPVLDGDGYDTYFDPSDDVFPRRAQVTLVITNTRGRPRVAALKEKLEASDEGMIIVDNSTIFRSDDHKYVKIGQEWIRYTHFGTGGSIFIAPGGRGARGTVPAEHLAGADVETGRTFVLTIDLPSSRELKE